MSRGDIQIDTSTNDIKIERADTNEYASNSWRYDSSNNIVFISLEIDKDYANDLIPSKDWKNFGVATEKLSVIDSSYDSADIYIEYMYLDAFGGSVSINISRGVFYSDGDTPKYITVADFNQIVNEIKTTDEDLTFGYSEYDDGSTVYGHIVIKRVVLGDFVVEDNVIQNEYILLNVSEGSFLQNPLQGVDINSFLQSPSTEQQLLDTVVEKFAQDSLRVMGIRKVGDSLIVQSEDFNV